MLQPHRTYTMLIGVTTLCPITHLVWPALALHCTMVKVRGFAECLQALRPGLAAVHDVTIAYHDYGNDGPPNEKTMLAGELVIQL